jgi:Flp pilus assembly protein TadD
MKNNVAYKFAASSLVLGLTTIGCTPASTSYRPTTASASVARAEGGAAKFYANAQAASQQGNHAEALTLAEKAVEFSPRDTGYRMLLADLYLKNGRFTSAESAFADLLTLDPGNSRASLSIALAQIAQGKTGDALAVLEVLSATAAPADVGLAFALAGQPQRAIEMLEPAARASDATGRVRQNLALAYSIAGDWQKARIIAAQDVAPADLDARLQQWAAFAQPSAPYTQVAALLAVTAVQDAGRPVRLALAPAAQQPVAFAEAEVAAPAVGGPVEPAAESPAGTTEAFAYQPPEQADVFAEAPAAPAPVQVPASAAKVQDVSEVRFAAAVQSLVEAPAPSRVSVPVASAPIRVFQPKKSVKKPQGAGRFVVQLGAYRNAVQVEKAWAQAQRRYRFGDSAPLSTKISIPGKGTFHRLAIAGFQTPVEAGQVCRSIRARQGVCFVRATAGDSPVQWASRYTGRKA